MADDDLRGRRGAHERRAAVFAALPRSAALPAPLPEAQGLRSDSGALTTRFTQALEAAGGHWTRVPDVSALVATLRDHPEVERASTLFSTIDGIASTTPDDPALDELAALDLAVLRATGPGVAESGALWWVPADLVERRAAFLAEHWILVADAALLVADLHQAYENIAPEASGYGCFVSGPSKTADIEQALVIGAHGPRSLHVFLVGDE